MGWTILIAVVLLLGILAIYLNEAARKRVREEEEFRESVRSMTSPRPDSGSGFPSKEEMKAEQSRLNAKFTCHDVRCKGFGKHRCHDGNCQQHLRTV